MSIAFVRSFALVAAVAGMSVAVAQTGAAPAPLSHAVAATQAAKADYAFDLEMNSAEQSWRARYDPAAAPALRLIQPATLEGEAQRSFERMTESVEGVSWCASEGLAEARNVRLLREDETSATYAFQPSAEMMRAGQGRSNQRGGGGGAGAAFANRMQGEFTITKQNPDITQMRIFTAQAFSPVPLVRLERMNFAIRCAVAPNGRRYAAETAMEFRGAAFGRRFDQQSVQRATNLAAR